MKLPIQKKWHFFQEFPIEWPRGNQMEKTKKTVQSEIKEKKSKTKTQKVPKLKKEPFTLAEELFMEQYNQHLDGKNRKEYPKILEDM